MAMDGMWRSIGYGWVLDIQSGATRWFDESPVGLIPVPPPTGGDPNAGLTRSGEVLQLREPFGLSTIEFARAQSTPAVIAGDAGGDPAVTFDVLWGTVRDHHAFLRTRGVDWEAVRHELRPRAAAATGDRQLFDVLAAALGALGDGHAAVEAPCGPPSTPTPGLAETRSWIADHSVPSAQVFGGGQLVAGMIDGDVGYLGILRMEGFASGSDAVEAEVACAERAVDEALEALAGASAVVIDLRGNTGGWDAVALALLAPFVEHDRALFTKCARSGTGTTTSTSVRLKPSRGRRFLGPLAILTGPLTASAAEVFTLASLEHERSLRVGAPTRGILSDELEKYLPNEWTFTLSNEIYADLSGRCPELVGLNPEVAVDDGHATTAGALLNGLRVAVAALADPRLDARHVRP